MRRAFVAGALGALALSISGAAQAALSSSGVAAVPTYESAGLYWQSPGGTAGCEVRYRRSGESAWKQGLAMWYDARDSQCRGSLVGLQAGSSYEAELNLPGQAASRAITFSTWPNQRPVARTIAVNGGSAQYTITEGGTASGWVVYEGNGATLDGANSAQYNILVKASYVIIRGLNLKGARQDAIRLDPTVHDIVIEDNDISGWGRTRDGTWATNLDSGIRGYCSSQDQLVRVTIQRNRIHDPRYGANSWSDGHPAGAQAVTFSHCGGQLVVRHNEMYSTTGRYFNDVIGGEDNFTKAGFPNADSDIYGNRISHAWDDGIESEGANENVRIWGNYIDRTAIGIATTATSVGPVYIFRNVWNRAQMYEKVSLDSDDRQPFFKSGGQDSLGHGRRYILHNTMLQARQSGLTYGLGGGFGLGGTGSTQLIQNTWSRNNIYHQWKDGKGFTYQTGTTSSFVTDMYNGTTGDTTVASGIKATPQYAPGHGWQSEAGGNYQLAPGTAGVGAGTRIANFNDDAAAPDVGAHQSGTASMKFGIAASPGSSTSGVAPARGVLDDFIENLYRTILARPSDPGGKAFYLDETERLASLGVDRREAVRVIAKAFLASAEYAQRQRSDAEYLDDLYFAFLRRAPDSGGKAFWLQQLVALGREGVILGFMFSPEFQSYMDGLFGAYSQRPETALVVDVYRGSLSRIPDSGGFAYWRDSLRKGQCTNTVDFTARTFVAGTFSSPEYAGRGRTTRQFVADLYDVFFRRPPDLGGFDFWVRWIDSGVGTRQGAVNSFLASSEWAGRVATLMAAGC
jgi:hypothetical protein